MRIRGRASQTGEPSLRRSLVLATLCLSLLVVSVDNTILNIALPALVRQLHATDSQLQWIVDSYAVVFGGLLLTAGGLGDRFGRKPVFLAGLLVFGAGSAGSAFAGSVGVLVASRAVMGVGAAGVMPATLSILMDVYRDPGPRARAVGLWSATTGLGIAIGPIAGGWLLSRYWWGSVFLVNVPIVVLGVAAALLLVPDSRDPEHRRADVLGVVLSVAGMSALLWAVIEIPQRGWTSPAVLGVGAVAAGLLAAFVLAERRAPEPMIVLGPFRDRRFSVAMTAVAFAVFTLMGAMFLLTQYLQFALGYSAFAAGIRILPVAGVLAVAAPLSTVLDRLAGTKAVVAAALALIGAGLWLASGTTPADGFPHLLPALLLLGCGAGLAVAPGTAAVLGALPRERAGVGSGTNGTALQVGGALGVAVLGAVLSGRYQGRMSALLAGHAMPEPARRAITGSLGGALAVAQQAGGALGTQLAAVARVAFVDGMGLAFGAAAVVAFAAAGLVLAALPSRSRSAPSRSAPSGPASGESGSVPTSAEDPRIPDPRRSRAATPPAS
ncbi:MFS transporter [Catenulispora subtropica]|uniref:Major facilitator superfamily (MFS) profile domain-containing protein n=1 Tax=Catenulispora subtropica TaxID=450798 RepID=A0ABN2TGK1_9ACTN